MCGPSTAFKNMANSVVNFAKTAQQQAGQVFGSASAVFNNLLGTLQNTVKGGPGQAGWGAAETNAVNAQIENNAAVSARNQKAAAGNAVSAIGGGNAVSPSGLETAVNLSTNANVEAAKSQQQEEATVANYQQGNQNYNTAVGEEMKLPSVFDSSTSATNAANSANETGMKAETDLSSAENWWQPMVMGALGDATQLGVKALTPTPSAPTPATPAT